MPETTIVIYTDGSCNPSYKIGVWASIIFINGEKMILKGIEHDVTHQQMELCAIIKSIKHLDDTIDLRYVHCNIYTDSQYVVGLEKRKEKLKTANFLTSKKISIRNIDYVKCLIDYMDVYQLQFIKVKAHQKTGDKENYNREVDILIRKELRKAIAQNTSPSETY